ncbi:sperm-tail PG-rich repeat-containing protein 2 [Mus pahari]|uniref:sperm-tail PG-rich repeat-containing protein 2 n=1 Tax=Mus pahari TaxID=10093 RepID=UPI000A306670|nr:sperm-tail PG-rich repeat-containing protein 2 [Mus pahari]
MYDRAPRWLACANRGSTGEYVGPGTYQVPFPKQQATGCYAPFLSLSSKTSAYVVSSYAGEAVPGPAHYNVSQAQYKIKGGRSLQNREKRFKKLISDGPGPASYNWPYLGTLCIATGQKTRTPAVPRSIDIPSIPSSGKSHGYHLNDDDTIMRRTPPPSDNTIGPAYYNPQFDYSKASLKYKGVNFGNTTGRQEFLKYSGPGPGQYDIIQKRKLHCENINIKRDQEHNYYTYVPRLYEAIILQEEKKGIPGPGKYNIKSEFDTIKSMSALVNSSSFIFFSETERFEPIKSCTPAPGTYNEIRTAFKYPKKRLGLSLPFGQSAARFTEDSKAQKLPGPGFYDISTNIVKAQVKNPCLKKQPKTGFGSSVPRTSFTAQKKAFSGPGPGDYQVRRTHDELPNLTNKYAAFLSRAERTPPVRKMRFPAPGRYNVQKSYEMSQVKHKYMPPRTLVAKKRHSSFLSAAPRCLGKIADGPDIKRIASVVSFVSLLDCEMAKALGKWSWRLSRESSQAGLLRQEASPE